MGRRALRRISPSIDYSQHLRTLDQLTAPLDFTALFSRAAPVEVEMGSGKGLFITNASGLRPEHNFLGVEIAEKYACFAAAKLAREQRANAKMVSGDVCFANSSPTPVCRRFTSTSPIRGGSRGIANAAC
jgi:tRNA (guanine-N7-)-methyltransferase